MADYEPMPKTPERPDPKEANRDPKNGPADPRKSPGDHDPVEKLPK